MKTVALLSGGKDSLYNMFLCTQDGHEIVAICNLRPPTDEQDELDSFMYQTVGHQAIQYIAKSMDIPLFQAKITRSTNDLKLDYTENPDDEVEDLYGLLNDVRYKHGINFSCISVGAIYSTYQKLRVENICKRMQLSMLAYLWEKDQDKLLQDMIDAKFDAILIKVACIGLDKNDVGVSIRNIQPKLRKLHEEFNINICGEGGEYESLVLDCPLFKKRLSIDKYSVLCHAENGGIGSVYYMRPENISLIDKKT